MEYKCVLAAQNAHVAFGKVMQAKVGDFNGPAQLPSEMNALSNYVQVPKIAAAFQHIDTATKWNTLDVSHMDNLHFLYWKQATQLARNRASNMKVTNFKSTQQVKDEAQTSQNTLQQFIACLEKFSSNQVVSGYTWLADLRQYNDMEVQVAAGKVFHSLESVDKHALSFEDVWTHADMDGKVDRNVNGPARAATDKLRRQMALVDSRMADWTSAFHVAKTDCTTLEQHQQFAQMCSRIENLELKLSTAQEHLAVAKKELVVSRWTLILFNIKHAFTGRWGRFTWGN